MIEEQGLTLERTRSRGGMASTTLEGLTACLSTTVPTGTVGGVRSPRCTEAWRPRPPSSGLCAFAMQDVLLDGRQLSVYSFSHGLFALSSCICRVTFTSCNYGDVSLWPTWERDSERWWCRRNAKLSVHRRIHEVAWSRSRRHCARPCRHRYRSLHRCRQHRRRIGGLIPSGKRCVHRCR